MFFISFTGFSQSVPVNDDGKIEYKEVVEENGNPEEFLSGPLPGLIPFTLIRLM